jgi:hypothetical protein
MVNDRLLEGPIVPSDGEGRGRGPNVVRACEDVVAEDLSNESSHRG